MDLWKEENRVLRGKLAPVFYSRAGEVLPLPPPFEEAIRKTTAAVCCLGCKHTHVGVPPRWWLSIRSPRKNNQHDRPQASRDYRRRA